MPVHHAAGVAGASGYVGGRLVPLLEAQLGVVRCLARNPDELRSHVKSTTEVVQGDVLDPASLGGALRGVRFGRPVVYHGTFATGLFQCVYQPGPAHWATLPATLEWHLLAPLDEGVARSRAS